MECWLCGKQLLRDDEIVKRDYASPGWRVNVAGKIATCKKCLRWIRPSAGACISEKKKRETGLIKRSEKIEKEIIISSLRKIALFLKEGRNPKDINDRRIFLFSLLEEVLQSLEEEPRRGN